MGYIDFDLGSTNIIKGVNVYIGGHTVNQSVANIYVDGVKILTNSYFGAIRYFSGVRGRIIRYETVALPNQFGQIMTWSEVGEFRALIETTPAVPTLTISRAVQVKWLTESAVIYQPQFSTNMASWQNYGDSVTGDGAEKSFTFLTDSLDSVFFRIQAR
jgi:hypothetical protein